MGAVTLLIDPAHENPAARTSGQVWDAASGGGWRADLDNVAKTEFLVRRAAAKHCSYGDYG
jgi:hypothetical protein